MTQSPRCEPPESERERRMHILADSTGALEPWIWLHGEWYGETYAHSPEEMAAEYRYVAPVLTPDEIADREREAYRRGQDVGGKSCGADIAVLEPEDKP